MFDQNDRFGTNPGSRRVLVIHNPIAGRRWRRRYRKTLDWLGRLGCHVTVMETAAKGDAESFANSYAMGYDVIAVAGGDGTINEVLNGMPSNGPALAVIPLGTANVLAAEIGIGGWARKIAETIAQGTPQEVHIGQANGRCFSMMAGVGFDAHVVSWVSPGFKRAWGKLAYVLLSLRGILRYRFPRYAVTIDGKRFEVASAVIAKGHYYAGRFVCAPQARLNSPDLHVCLFQRGGPAHVVRYGLWLVMGRLHRLPDISILPARAVEVEATGPDPEPLQGDGDIIGSLPARIRVESKSRLFLVPEGSPLRRLADKVTPDRELAVA